MTLEVRIDRDRCMGSGNCAFRSPETFDLDADGLAIVVGDPAADEGRVRHAVDDCPTGALSITIAPTPSAERGDPAHPRTNEGAM